MENNAKFPGWDLSKKIMIVKNGEEQKVFLEGRPYMIWPYNDQDYLSRGPYFKITVTPSF